MNKKRSLFITIIAIILLLSPSLKSLKIKINQKNLDTDIDNKKCYCQGLVNKISNVEKNLGFYFGLLKGGEDLPEGEKHTKRVPSSWDWRNHEGYDWTTSIKEQGSCGSCYAFGLYSAMESCIKIKKNKPNYFIDLSEQYMISCGTEWTSGIFGCEGAYMSSILDFVESYGAIPESCFPYKSGNGNLPPCKDKCEDWDKYKTEIIGWSTISPSLLSMKNALANNGPLVTSIDIYENFPTYSEGVYEPSGDLLGYHLVSIVGYNDNPGYWICKNSWGTEWGEDGWFRIKYNVCEIEDNTISIDVQDNTEFFNRLKCGTDTYKRSGDIYDYNSCTVSMSEHFWAGPASAWYHFNIDEGKISDGMEIGIEFCDRSFAGNGPNLYVFNWYQNCYIKLGKNLGHWHDPKWVWIETSDSNNYTTFSGLIEVMVTTEDEDLTLLCNVGLRGKMAKSNLKCIGNLHFGLIEPGQSVVDNINVKNIGDPNSELSWRVEDWPDWGEWIFSLLKGDGLRTDQRPTTIIVSITAPYVFKKFYGEVRIVNIDDQSDHEIIEVSFSTPFFKI